MTPYKQWSGETRDYSLKITKKAINNGLIKLSKVCCICGDAAQHTHVTNYDKHIAEVEHLLSSGKLTSFIEVCVPCHLAIHGLHSKTYGQKNMEYVDSRGLCEKIKPYV